MIQLKRSQALLGTFVDITLEGRDKKILSHAMQECFHLLKEIEAIFNYHDKNSELSKLNQAPISSALSINTHLYKVLEYSHKISHLSDGLFDPSIAPYLVEHNYLPDHGFDLAHTQTNWMDLFLLNNHQVYKLKNMHIDLSGIAKGYAVDCAIEFLKDLNVNSATVNAGGDLRSFGLTFKEIYVKHPVLPTDLVYLENIQTGAVATSASYYSGKKCNNKKLTPLINPLNRQCVVADISVTVFAPTCLIADALTKVLHADATVAGKVLDYFEARAIIIKEDILTQDLLIFDSKPKTHPDHNEDSQYSYPIKLS